MDPTFYAQPFYWVCVYVKSTRKQFHNRNLFNVLHAKKQVATETAAAEAAKPVESNANAGIEH